MINKIIHTLGSRLIIALLSFALLLITTRWMGAEVKGEISLFILNISIATIVSGLFGGPALVYLATRNALKSLVQINLIWSLISCALLTLILYASDLNSNISAFRFFRMSFFESIIATNLMLLLGYEQIKWHNILQLLKVFVTVVALLGFLQIHVSDLIEFVNAYELSLLITLGLSIVGLIKLTPVSDARSRFVEVVRSCFTYGGLVQLGNIAQLLNYRLSYYLLELLVSPPQLALIRIGIYSASLQVAESLWQFTRSVNTVQYARVSNISDVGEALGISIRLIRLNYMVTMVGILIVLILPLSTYSTLFGSEFIEIKSHFLVLSPGILALAFGGAINHFFAGIGQHRFNTYNSIIGLALTLALAYPLIETFETMGAAVATSIVYSLQAVIQIWFLKRHHTVSLPDFLIQRSDFVELKEGLSKVWNRISGKS